MLKPLDVFIGLKILTLNPGWSQHGLAKQLSVSSYSINTALKMLRRVKLLRFYHGHYTPIVENWEELLLSSIQYHFPAEAKGLVVGLPTAYAAKPLSDDIVQSEDPVPVWASASGAVKGLALEPLHPSAPKIAGNPEEAEFYALLALVDTLRWTGSRARERNLAKQYCQEKLAAIQENFKACA